MGTFEALWGQQSNASPKEKGDRFEELSKWFLENDPVYKRLFTAVYRWKEWPSRWSDADNGIDLIAEGKNGQTWAIQCKGYGESADITKADIDSFVAESTRPAIDNLLLLATKESIGPKVRKLLQETEKPAEWLLAEAFRSRDLDWPEDFAALRPAKQQRKTPRPHQLEAVQSIAEGLKDADRGQAIMACGTGKTFTSVLVAEKLNAQTILVLVPSIWLVSQTLSEWAASWQGDFRFLAVCSDQKAGDGSITSVNHEELGIPSTTQLAEIKKWMSDSGAEPSVIFSTYQSSPLVREAAQATENFRFDLAIADEAHRTVTRGNSSFSEIHEGLSPLCSKTLFMTATPRILGKTVAQELTSRGYTNYSMDNPDQFGEVVYELPFSAAIDLDLLVDYEAVATIVSDDQIRALMENRALVETDSGDDLEADELLAMVGLARRIHEHDLKRVITFHSTIIRAERFAKYFQRTAQWAFPESKHFKNLEHHTVSAKITGGERRRRISALSHQSSKGTALISNARVLTEGIDIPAVDAVAFVDPKHSVVDITQAIGRVLRKSPGKTIGQVIVVAPLNEHQPIDEQLADDKRLQTIWRVVQALRAHDERLEDWLDSVRTQMGRRRISKPDGVAITIDAPWKIASDVANKIQLKIIEKSTESWRFMYGVLQDIVDKTGSAMIGTAHETEGGIKIGQWVGIQRYAFSKGYIREQRQVLLEALPGWEWDAEKSEFLRKADLLETYFREFDTDTVHKSDRFYGGVDLTAFVGYLRRVRQGSLPGELAQYQIERLERIPNWRWERTDLKSRSVVRKSIREKAELLSAYYQEFEEVLTHELAHKFRGVDLYQWAATIRRNWRQGKLSPAEVELFEKFPLWYWDLNALPANLRLRKQGVRGPSPKTPNSVRNWVTQFDRVLREYQSEFKTIAVLKESGEDYQGVNLVNKVQSVRGQKRKNQLTEAEIELLESNVKWYWNASDEPPPPIRSRIAKYAPEYRKYSEVTGSGTVPMKADRNLHQWVKYVRDAHENGELTAEEIELLESIPLWSWSSNSEWHKARNVEFEEIFAVFEAYFAEFQTPTFKRGKYKGINLDFYASKWRAQYQENTLPVDQLKKLESLKPYWRWSASDELDPSIIRPHVRKKLEPLARYVDRFGPVIRRDTGRNFQGENLFSFVTRVRRSKREGDLTAAEISALEAIPGWDWDPSRWKS